MSERISSQEWRPELGSAFRGQSVTVHEYRCRSCGVIGDFMYFKNGYCPEHRPSQTTQAEPLPQELHGQCFGVWKEQVKAEMERKEFSQHDILTMNWEEWHEEYYSIGLTPLEAVTAELSASPKAATYRETIIDCLGGPRSHYDPRHIEAYMRLEHPTLDGLSREQFEQEVAIACSCIDIGGKKKAESVARSYGL